MDKSEEKKLGTLNVEAGMDSSQLDDVIIQILSARADQTSGFEQRLFGVGGPVLLAGGIAFLTAAITGVMPEGFYTAATGFVGAVGVATGIAAIGRAIIDSVKNVQIKKRLEALLLKAIEIYEKMCQTKGVDEITSKYVKDVAGLLGMQSKRARKIDNLCLISKKTIDKGSANMLSSYLWVKRVLKSRARSSK